MTLKKGKSKINGAMIKILLFLIINVSGYGDNNFHSPWRLKPGDVILMKMWRHPEISDTFFVDANGEVDFPLIGVLKVDGMTSQELRDTLVELYRTYYQNPALTIIPLFKVAIIGEVKNPGVYLVKETDGFFEVLALAGGPTPKADLTRAKIRREGKTITLNLKEAITGKKTLRELGLMSGDIIVIPKKVLPSMTEIYYFFTTLALIITLYFTLKGGGG